MNKKASPNSIRQSKGQRHAIVVLPPAAAVQEILSTEAAWIARGRIDYSADRGETLACILGELGERPPQDGLAALRLWGQTGQRPTQWMCAADPVYLEAMLDHVRLHALDESVLTTGERRRLIDFLQQESGDDERQYLLMGEFSYLCGGKPFATARRSAGQVDQGEPNDDLPRGAGSKDHDRLTGELQLLLHDAGINRRRQEQGNLPVNSLWFWGGGVAPPVCERPLPPLYGADPLTRGFWYSAGLVASPLTDIYEQQPTGYVAILPGSAREPFEAARFFDRLKRQLWRGSVRRATLVFADGCLVRIGRRQLLAFWRGRERPWWRR